MQRPDKRMHVIAHRFWRSLACSSRARFKHRSYGENKCDSGRVNLSPCHPLREIPCGVPWRCRASCRRITNFSDDRFNFESQIAIARQDFKQNRSWGLLRLCSCQNVDVSPCWHAAYANGIRTHFAADNHRGWTSQNTNGDFAEDFPYRLSTFVFFVPFLLSFIFRIFPFQSFAFRTIRSIATVQSLLLSTVVYRSYFISNVRLSSPCYYHRRYFALVLLFALVKFACDTFCIFLSKARFTSLWWKRIKIRGDQISSLYWIFAPFYVLSARFPGQATRNELPDTISSRLIRRFQEVVYLFPRFQLQRSLSLEHFTRDSCFHRATMQADFQTIFARPVTFRGVCPANSRWKSASISLRDKHDLCLLKRGFKKFRVSSPFVSVSIPQTQPISFNYLHTPRREQEITFVASYFTAEWSVLYADVKAILRGNTANAVSSRATRPPQLASALTLENLSDSISKKFRWVTFLLQKHITHVHPLILIISESTRHFQLRPTYLSLIPLKQPSACFTRFKKYLQRRGS